MGNLQAAKELRKKLNLEKDKAQSSVKATAKPLDKQNKEELTETAKALGIEVKEETKAQIIELIEAKQKEA
jgi:hypothetical protein